MSPNGSSSISRIFGQDPDRVGLTLTFLDVSVTGDVQPLGSLDLRLEPTNPARPAAGPALVVSRSPPDQTRPFPGD